LSTQRLDFRDKSKGQFYHAKENLASAKIVKIEFNANLEWRNLLGFPVL